MRLQSKKQRSRRTLDKWLEPAASAEVRRPLVRQESKRTRECRERMSPADRRAGRLGNQAVADVALDLWHGRANHRAGRRRSIRLDKLLHTRVRVRSFVDRNKMCT